ncbi:MAG: hypothetical protein AB1428_07985 [Bacteroidota bacterium]
MSHFAFYRGTNAALARRLKSSCAAQWGKTVEAHAGACHLIVPAADAGFTLADTDRAVGAVGGYVRHDDLGNHPDVEHNRRFVDAMMDVKRWPLAEEWTGSFGAVACRKKGGDLILCNDPIGFLPVYYAVVAGGIVGGTSLIVLNRVLRAPVDVTGLVQRITPPYSNYGRRTLLTGVMRILPGEYLRFPARSTTPRSVFDNTLCNGIINTGVDTAARIVWDSLQHEATLAVGRAESFCVAMSGGWDSRVVLAGVAHRGAAIECLTYGNPEAYETIIARRCARAVGARHASFSIEDNYFPPRDGFERLVRETEAFCIPEWYSMISARKDGGKPKEIILLGDHAQGIDGRYMTNLSSRGARRKSFVNSLMGKADPLTAATAEEFERWRRARLSLLMDDLRAGITRLSPAMAAKRSAEVILAESQADFLLSAGRVEANMPPFAEMFDELFIWFTKTRFTLASQNLLLRSTFRPMSPTMSLRALRLLSRVHPRLRVRRRLMDALARLPEFDKLGAIPSAQIPGLSARTPSLIRELTWGLRSGADQVLIRRVLKSKNPNKRQRVLKSLDYIKEYRRPYAPSRVREWFTGRWVRGEPYVEMTKQRGALVSWPLINLDIAAPANVSMTLDACIAGGKK